VFGASLNRVSLQRRIRETFSRGVNLFPKSIAAALLERMHLLPGQTVEQSALGAGEALNGTL